jgi:4'-phosphopantetheinyl transferase
VSSACPLFPDASARIRLAVLGPSADPPLAALSPEERDRLATFRHVARQRQFALGRALLRGLAAEALGCTSGAVPLWVAEDGAPEIEGLYPALAHTMDTAGTIRAVAALGEGPLGVDIEAVRPRHPELWQRILVAEEYALLEALGGGDGAQVTLWALKEAVLKAERTGFRQAAQRVRLTLDADEQRGEARTPVGRWQLRWRAVEGCVVALAT